jgi:hypothetical protein
VARRPTVARSVRAARPRLHRQRPTGWPESLGVSRFWVPIPSMGIAHEDQTPISRCSSSSACRWQVAEAQIPAVRGTAAAGEHTLPGGSSGNAGQAGSGDHVGSGGTGGSPGIAGAQGGAGAGGSAGASAGGTSGTGGASGTGGTTGMAGGGGVSGTTGRNEPSESPSRGIRSRSPRAPICRPAV